MKKILGQIFPDQKFRSCDKFGCGYFGASRKRLIKGKWKRIFGAHKGLDIISTVGQSVQSPIAGKIVKVGQAYGDDTRYKSLHIEGQDGVYIGVKIKLLYLESELKVGDVVLRGDIVGKAQDLTAKYEGITNHIHLEVYFGGEIINPRNLFGEEGIEQVDNEPFRSQEYDESEIIPYTYPGLDTVSLVDLMKGKEFKFVTLNSSELYSIVHGGKSNRQRIFEALSISEKKKLSFSLEYNQSINYPISQGVTIYIPQDTIRIRNTYDSNITVTKTEAHKYFPALISQITNDPGYVAAKNAKSGLQQIYPELTVWLWSRAKYLEGESGFIDITNDVLSCNTESNLDAGGNFSITLSSPNATLVDGKWQKQVIQDNIHINSVNRKRTFGQYNKNEFVRNSFYYDVICQQNDLIFISYEKLLIDGDNSTLTDLVGGKWYDMIGMIDIVEQDLNASNNDHSVIIRGRDGIKIFQDDNSYFNPYSIGHSASVYGGQFGSNSRYLDGQFQEIAAIIPRTIRQGFEFIFNRIASIGYVPDDIFSSFTYKTATSVITESIEGTNKGTVTKGIWQLVKVFIDESISDLKVVDDSVANPQGSVLDIIMKIAQQPFVETVVDTYGDKIYIIFRQPPFTQDSIREILNSVVDVQDTNNALSPTPTNNTYNESQIALDNQSDEENSLILPKDNYGNVVLSQVNITHNDFPQVINIDEKDVLDERLRYNNESYGWYKINDQGNFGGNPVSLGHVPSIYFDEYAQVFGNKMLEITNNYSNYRFWDDADKNVQSDRYAEQASQLLSYLVETNIYLPFTRTGEIQINGDRRIKKGNWIYYRPTQELFYVTEVVQSYSISNEQVDRTTTLTVERGMMKKYISERDVDIVDENGLSKTIQVSYFNIVDIEKLRKGIRDTVSGKSASDKFNHKSNMSVNTDVLNYLLTKRQKHIEESRVS